MVTTMTVSDECHMKSVCPGSAVRAQVTSLTPCYCIARQQPWATRSHASWSSASEVNGLYAIWHYQDLINFILIYYFNFYLLYAVLCGVIATSDDSAISTAPSFKGHSTDRFVVG